jgi:hypothetical protein
MIAHSWALIYRPKTAYADFSAIPLIILLLSVYLPGTPIIVALRLSPRHSHCGRDACQKAA